MMLSLSKVAYDEPDTPVSPAHSMTKTIYLKKFKKNEGLTSIVDQMKRNEFMEQIQIDLEQKKEKFPFLKKELSMLNKECKAYNQKLELIKYQLEKNENLSSINESNIKFIETNNNSYINDTESTRLINQSLSFIRKKNYHFRSASKIKKKVENNSDSLISSLMSDRKNSLPMKPKGIYFDAETNKIEFDKKDFCEEKEENGKWKLEKCNYLEKNKQFKKILSNKKNSSASVVLTTIEEPMERILDHKSVNKIEKYRKIFIIYGSFNKFCPVKCSQILLPIYKTIVDKHTFRTETDLWLKKAKDLLNLSVSLNYMSLINGERINYLAEVPNECNILILDNVSTNEFWLNVLKFHKINSLPRIKFDFIMHLVNTRKNQKEIMLFINDREKFQTIKNESEEVFFNFNISPLSKLKKKHFHTTEIIKTSIFESLDEMENEFCRKMAEIAGEEDEEKVDEFYKSIMENTIREIYDKIKYISNEEFVKRASNDSELKFFIDEQMLTQEERVMVAEKFEFLLKLYQKENIKKKSKFASPQKINPKINKNNNIPISHKKNYIENNIKRLKKDLARTVENIDKKYPSLFQLNIPKIESEYIFSRFELHSFYSKFKALIYMNALDTKQKDFAVEKGINIESFRKGLSENLASAHEELIKRMFSVNSDSSTMRWNQYLNILNSVRAKSLKAKLDLFFTLMDTDGNGCLSWDEIQYLCENSIKKLLGGTDEAFIADLAFTFTKFVFNLMDLEEDEEIQVENLKEVMSSSQSDEVDLLLMMCCAEKEEAGNNIEDNITKEDKGLLEQYENSNDHKIEFLEKENKNLKKLAILNDNNKNKRRSQIINQALQLNIGKRQIESDEDVEKKEREEELMNNLKVKAKARRSQILELAQLE